MDKPDQPYPHLVPAPREEPDRDILLHKAKALAAQRVNDFSTNREFRVGPDDFYIVWFAKVLQNFKALVFSDKVPKRYFEVTHDGDKGITYIDTYAKTSNHEYLD